jgi:hypothetical protein
MIILGWGREESQKTPVWEQVTKQICDDNAQPGKGTIPEKSGLGTDIPHEIQSFPKHSGLELGNIQEKSQQGTGTPDEFPRFPEISGLR